MPTVHATDNNNDEDNNTDDIMISMSIQVKCLGGLSLPRKSVVRLTDRPDMTLDVYRGHKTTIQQQCPSSLQWL